MRLLLTALLATSLAACDGGDPISAPPPADPSAGTLATAPLQDALERIVPSLGTSVAVTALQAALAAALENRSAEAVPAVESALQQLEAEQPDAAVEADVIRLAISAHP